MQPQPYCYYLRDDGFEQCFRSGSELPRSGNKILSIKLFIKVKPVKVFKILTWRRHNFLPTIPKLQP